MRACASQDFDRVGPLRRGLPVCVCGSRCPGPGRLAAPSLLDGGFHDLIVMNKVAQLSRYRYKTRSLIYG